MEYRVLTEKLQEKEISFSTFGCSSPDIDLIDIRFVTKNQLKFKESTLYLCSTDMLPDPELQLSFIIFCYGAPVDFSAYCDSDFHIVYFGGKFSQTELFNIAIENMDESTYISRAMYTLTTALYSGKGLAYLIDRAADILGNPIYVVDLQYKYLAISSNVSPENSFLLRESESPYIREEGILYIRRNKISEKVRKNLLPIYFFNEIAGEGTMICAIHLGGIEVGHIMIQETEHKFKESDRDLLYNLSKLVALELQKSSVFHDNKGMMYSYFLADILKDNNATAGSVRPRLESLGFKLKPTLYMLVIPSSSYHTSSIKLEAIIQSIKSIFIDCLYVIFENSIVFLISKDKYKEFS